MEMKPVVLSGVNSPEESLEKPITSTVPEAWNEVEALNPPQTIGQVIEML